MSALTLGGGPLNSEYMSTLDRAEIRTEMASRERRALEVGRRQSDREIETLQSRLRLARNLLSQAINHIESGMHTEQELTALTMGLEVITE